MHTWSSAKYVMFAVFFGIVACQLLLHFFWWLAQRQELHIRKWRRRVNSARKACRGRSCYTTHSPRKLTWTTPTIFCRNFWVITAIFTTVGLTYLPSMPDLVCFHAHAPVSTSSSPTGLILPPVPEFDPPQWFDPPHRDQIFWLKNVATVVRHSAEVSRQVFTMGLPVTDMPFFIPTEPLLTDSLAAAAQVEPSNKATSFLLNITGCINPDAEARSVKGERPPAMALSLSQQNNKHNRLISSSLEPVHPLVGFPHKPKFLMQIHAASDSIKPVAASDGRIRDDCCRADAATAVAIWFPPEPLRGVSASAMWSFTALVRWSSLTALLGIDTPAAETFTALAVWTPLQALPAVGVCSAQEVPTAVTSLDHTMPIEATVSGAALAAALTTFPAGKDTLTLEFLMPLICAGESTILVPLADPTYFWGKLKSAPCRLICQGQTHASPSRHASSSRQPQLSFVIRHTSLKRHLRSQSSLTDPRAPLMTTSAYDPFALQASLNITSNLAKPPPMPTALHRDAASGHISTSERIKTLCNHASSMQSTCICLSRPRSLSVPFV